jgi:hypothetical protein
MNHCMTFEAQTAEATRIFQPHLETLGTKTRPVRDWVQDVILQPWDKESRPIFSLGDHIDTLDGQFDFYNSSPSFMVDDRWYKKIGKSASSSNTIARNQVPAFELSLIDYRIPFVEILKLENIPDFQKTCKTLLEIQNAIVWSGTYVLLEEFLSHLRALRDSLPELFSPTIQALDDFIENFPRFINGDIDLPFEYFSHWWGRGQQYVSFIKHVQD